MYSRIINLGTDYAENEQLMLRSRLLNKKDAVVELDNGKTELISQDYLESELNSSIKELPPERIAYTQGVGIEYNVRLSQETWEKLNEYAARVGTATLSAFKKFSWENSEIAWRLKILL